MNPFTIALSKLINQSIRGPSEKDQNRASDSGLTTNAGRRKKVYKNTRRENMNRERPTEFQRELLAARLDSHSTRAERDAGDRPAGPRACRPKPIPDPLAPCPLPHCPTGEQEVGINLKLKPACAPRDIQVLVTVSGPYGRPCRRIGASAPAPQANNENVRTVFD